MLQGMFLFALRALVLLGLRPGCFLKQFFYPPGGLLLGLRPGCFQKQFFCPTGRGVKGVFSPSRGGFLVLGLRPEHFRCAAAVGFAYRRVTFLCDKKVTKKTPSGALRGPLSGLGHCS